jgi:hypothetical protein
MLVGVFLRLYLQQPCQVYLCIYFNSLKKRPAYKSEKNIRKQCLTGMVVRQKKTARRLKDISALRLLEYPGVFLREGPRPRPELPEQIVIMAAARGFPSTKGNKIEIIQFVRAYVCTEARSRGRFIAAKNFAGTLKTVAFSSCLAEFGQGSALLGSTLPTKENNAGN